MILALRAQHHGQQLVDLVPAMGAECRSIYAVNKEGQLTTDCCTTRSLCCCSERRDLCAHIVERIQDMEAVIAAHKAGKPEPELEWTDYKPWEIADNAAKVSSPFLCLPDCTAGAP